MVFSKKRHIFAILRSYWAVKIILYIIFNMKDLYSFVPTGFDYVNPEAEVVIVGITPGNSQLKGEREEMSPEEIKRTYAFKGRTRDNIVKMLDFIGVNTLLGIETCASFWGEDFGRVELTSLLKEATFELKEDGRIEMFKKTKDIAKSKLLTEKFENGFVKDCAQYTKAKLFVACGEGVYDELLKLKDCGIITAPVVGIAHPSGNNAMRVLYYMRQLDSSLEWCEERSNEARTIIDKLQQI